MKTRLGVIMCTLVLILPLSASAIATGAPFGGLVTYSIPCTCSGGLWIQYSMLFLGSDLPVAGALYWPPLAPVFQFFQIGTPLTFELGSYVPDPPGQCLVVSGTGCALLPALGTIEYTGTSSSYPQSELSSFGIGF